MPNEDVFHIGVKLLLFDRDSRMLLLRKAQRMEGSAHWDVPGGRIMRGEDARAALIREVYEETALRIDSGALDFVGCHLSSTRIPLGESDVGLVFFFYKRRLDADVSVALSDEHTDYVWAAPKDAASKMAPAIPEAYILDAYPDSAE